MANFATPYLNKNPRPVVKTGTEGAKQSFKEECDINTIMKRYARTGALPAGVGLARYGDFTGAEDFLEAQLTVKRANEQFEALPSRVRERFNNKPGFMLAFLEDKANLAEAKELGLLKDEVEIPKEEPPKPKPAP